MKLSDGRFILTQKGCPHCKNWKEKNSDLLKKKKVKEIKIGKVKNGSEWEDIIRGLPVRHVPTVIKVDGKKVCEVPANKPLGHPTTKCYLKSSAGGYNSIDEYVQNFTKD